MFEKLVLTNFQCHKSLSLDLGKITTFIGPSDSGKTATLRALEWLCFNEGRVKLLQRRGAEDVSVSLVVDGHTITRSTKENSYQLDSTLYKTINRTIPSKIVDLLQMSRDNIQTQHDYLFWFSASGSDIVSNLNQVVDLSRLEKWIDVGSEKVRKYKEEFNYHIKRRDELEAKITELEPYRDIDNELSEIESLSDSICSSKEKYEALLKIVDSIESCDSRLSKLDSYIDDLTEITQMYGALNAKQDRYDDLSRYIRRNNQLNGQLDKMNELLADLPNCDEIIEKKKRYSSISSILGQIDLLPVDVEIPLLECETLMGHIERYNDLRDILMVISKHNKDIYAKDDEIEELTKVKKKFED